MKAKLIKRENHYDLFEETRFISTTECEDGTVNKLSKQNCDEIFGVIDVEKLAKESTLDVKETNSDFIFKEVYEEFFKEGFHKAMELNKDKQFTLEDFKLFARMYYREIRMNKSNLLWDSLADKCLEEHLTLIQQPKEIKVEIEMDAIPADRAPNGLDTFPKLDSDGCLILKKKEV
jgi:hypothetical protein